MYYVAAPYTSKSAKQQKSRFLLNLQLTARLMATHEEYIYSPIIQGHMSVPYLPQNLANSHEFWMQRSREALKEACGVFLLPLPGWQESTGVAEELSLCLKWRKCVYVVLLQDWAKERLQLYCDSDDFPVVAEDLTILANENPGDLRKIFSQSELYDIFKLKTINPPRRARNANR